ncbi:hypothetical protein SLEP1_g24852 [Rubroshorea leprosula]|uniref:Uncharacterized protein n=1 Tax=Rubroshorea leprosula TaxID=152421 RepID=A0AAV5JT34_9ROSI|nr:hypothetical protein SLEP1_g24852 [Rubroshorea leprosula]
MIDLVVAGSLMGKIPEEAYKLVEEMASNNCRWNSERTPIKRSAGIHEVDTLKVLTAQVEALHKKFDKLNASTRHVQHVTCDWCGGGHTSAECQFIAVSESRFQSQEAATKNLEAIVQNQGAAIRNLEVQVGQLANMISGRNQGALLSNTEINPKEHVNAITLRSGKQIRRGQDMISESKEKEKEIHGEDEVQEPPKPKEIKPYVPPIPFP